MGGAIFQHSGALAIKNSTFVANNGRWGGAIASWGTTPTSLTIEGSEFYENHATTKGGAIFNCGSSLLLVNTTVMRNQTCSQNCAPYNIGGGIWTTTEPVLKHSTVADNLPDDIAIRAACTPY